MYIFISLDNTKKFELLVGIKVLLEFMVFKIFCF